MNTIPTRCLLGGLLALSLLAYAGEGDGTQHIVIDSGDTARSWEAARQSQEQWNATHGLRNKVNTRVEKDFDRYDQAVDLQEKCNSSQNVNAYWEPNTSRCLDRRTGRSLLAP
ncbi:hypothetical protein SGGMMB4_03317 [Sodalis glossinidius str. 'morsitans']|uniref:UPF0482 protein SG1468 n=2 Tax=Sodalis glossinidius (strain morsitans) TaxID=343509 RepID=Y1468_SODGM|nr:DUF1283 family protein [Sodalis glossinidius]Q2NSY2.1 RecName: Full=UPF0482 protein SG1468; Flags: Precursor [Sodalis glossinidius str. 'morsitans']BAE74743.1 conserved hypothetical protein [Sodalis glossinidius str. 'morsitans']CRL45524.1 hypothetical protein SGGMMB4_03317 [Sodalis glossinidius str. 'morsitans']